MFDALFIIVPILIILIFALTIISIISPKFRGKMMSRQIKAGRYMIEESKEDWEKMGTTVGNVGVNIKKNIMDENEDNLKDLARREANIEKEKIEIKAKALKDGLTGNKIYCKHCGSLIDEDSKFCKNCGKEL